MQAVQPLKEHLPIERARMRLKIQVPSSSREELMSLLGSKQATVESQDLGFSNNQVRPLQALEPLLRAVSIRPQEACMTGHDNDHEPAAGLTCCMTFEQIAIWSEVHVWDDIRGSGALQVTLMCLIEPGAFREMHAFVQKSYDGAGRLEVISLAATEEVGHAHDGAGGLPSMPAAATEPAAAPPVAGTCNNSSTIRQACQRLRPLNRK